MDSKKKRKLLALDALDAIFAKVPERSKSKKKEPKLLGDSSSSKTLINSQSPIVKARESNAEHGSTESRASKSTDVLDDIFSSIVSGKKKNKRNRKTEHIESVTAESVDEYKTEKSKLGESPRRTRKHRAITSLDELFKRSIEPKSRAAMLLGSLESRSILLDNPKKMFDLASERRRKLRRKIADSLHGGNGLSRKQVKQLITTMQNENGVPSWAELQTLHQDWTEYFKAQMGSTIDLSQLKSNPTAERSLMLRLANVSLNGAILSQVDFSFYRSSRCTDIQKLETSLKGHHAMILFESKNSFVTARYRDDAWEQHTSPEIHVEIIPKPNVIFHITSLSGKGFYRTPKSDSV